MSAAESESEYASFQEYGETKSEKSSPPRPKDLKWVGFALIATVCFAASGYILGFLSAAGISAKFLNSLGYFTIAMCIIISKQIAHISNRAALSKEERQATP